MTAPTVHASCVVVGTVGILIRGRSGSGKSTLAVALVQAGSSAGHFASHVSDDRTHLRSVGGVVLASAAEALKGLVEVRGLGVLSVPFEAEARVGLIIDLLPSGAIERMPDMEALVAQIEGVRLPRIAVGEQAAQEAIGMTRLAIGRLFPNGPTYL